MPHLLKEYSKNLGVEPSKVIVNKHFYPISCDNFIVIYNEQKTKSKTYRYYSLVIDILRSVLNYHNIEVVVIGSDVGASNRADHIYSNLSFKENAYIISKSKLFISIDNALTQYSSSVGVPVINLYGNIYPSITTPFWASKNKKIDIEPNWEGKPCMSLNDPNDSINKIPAEEIALSVVNILKLGEQKFINFKTKLINKIHANCIDVIPTKYVDLPIFKNEILNLRLDKSPVDEKSFFSYCLNHKCNLVTEDVVIQLNSIEKISKNINSIRLILNTMPNKIPEKYFSILKRWGIDFEILVKNESILEDVKFEYFDQEVSFIDTSCKKPKEIDSSDRFFSFKKVVEGDKVYKCMNHWKNNIDNDDNIVDNPDYWEELDYFYIYEQHRNG